MKQLPEIKGPVSVTFKHENTIDGISIGPIMVIAIEPYEAWLKIHGTPRTNRRGELRYSLPFGSNPDGRHDLGWDTKIAAREVAAHYDVSLEEF